MDADGRRWTQNGRNKVIYRLNRSNHLGLLYMLGPHSRLRFEAQQALQGRSARATTSGRASLNWSCCGFINERQKNPNRIIRSCSVWLAPLPCHVGLKTTISPLLTSRSSRLYPFFGPTRTRA